MAVTRMKRIKAIIEGGISTKDHGHLAITNEEAEEIKHPGVGDGQGGLVCCNSWSHKESDMTERLN